MTYCKLVRLFLFTFPLLTILLHPPISFGAGSDNCDQKCIDNLQQKIQVQQQQLDAQQKILNELVKKIDELASQQDSASTPTINGSPQQIKSGNMDVKLSISGQVNRGVLYADDGGDSEIYFVDNDNSSTRIRLIGEAAPNDDLTIGSQIEVQFESNSTASVNQNNQSAGPNNFTERKLELYIDSKSKGRLWLGQGDTASNSSSELDLSGTTVIGYSGISDLAGGILFRDKTTGQLTETSIGSTFSNLDGLSRDDRIRYDTPSINGFKLSASAISNSRSDVALRHSGKFGSVKTAAALAYADPNDDRNSRVSGSFSLLHDNGFSFTAAIGEDDRQDRDPSFWYSNIGYQTDIYSVGKTAFSIDFYSGDDIKLMGDKSESIGLFAVQNLNRYGTQLYLGVRNHELNTAAFQAGDVFATLAGARVKF